MQWVRAVSICVFKVKCDGRAIPCDYTEPVLSTYVLLTYSMVQSPSWEANWFAASQEIPRISRNPKVHYRTHKRPPPASILGQPNPVHIPTSWRSVLILFTHIRLGLPSGLFPSGFPTKTQWRQNLSAHLRNSISNTNRLTLFWKTMAFYGKNHTEYTTCRIL